MVTVVEPNVILMWSFYLTNWAINIFVFFILLHRSDNQGLTKCSLDGDEGDDDEDDGSKQNRTSGKTKTSWPQSLPRTKGELSLDVSQFLW